ncbi:MAG: DUF1295 domain-containing protein [Myxococcales bacterium]|nr:DUF1295 domain-containing protein [Myxococcales bacterium]
MSPTDDRSPTPTTSAGVDRSHDHSTVQKLAFIGVHALSVAIAAWVVFGGGTAAIGSLFGRSWRVHDPTRAALVFGAAVLYFVRHAITLFYLIMRRITWSEGMGLGVFILAIEVGFCLLSTGATRSAAMALGWLDYLAIALVLVGSYLNSASEIGRKWWKRDPANKGHCYTEGLFRYSMHINYFGDTLMFSGWCLLTSVFWTLAVAAMMTAMFIFMHIPGLDSYLAERYGEEFRAYAARTKKFVPWVY